MGVALARGHQPLVHRRLAGDCQPQHADALGPVQERHPQSPALPGVTLDVEDRRVRERAPSDRAPNRQRLVFVRVRRRHGHQRALLVVDDVDDERIHADPSRLLGDHAPEVFGRAQMRPAQHLLEHHTDACVELRDRDIAHCPLPNYPQRRTYTRYKAPRLARGVPGQCRDMRGDETSRSTGGVTLREDVRDSTLELTVAGDLDMAAAFELETRLDALLCAGDVNAVVMDLARVGFIDSAGVGALVAIRERAQQLGIDLTITRVSDRVRRILYLTGLGDIAEG